VPIRTIFFFRRRSEKVVIGCIVVVIGRIVVVTGATCNVVDGATVAGATVVIGWIVDSVDDGVIDVVVVDGKVYVIVGETVVIGVEIVVIARDTGATIVALMVMGEVGVAGVAVVVNVVIGWIVDSVDDGMIDVVVEDGKVYVIAGETVVIGVAIVVNERETGAIVALMVMGEVGVAGVAVVVNVVIGTNVALFNIDLLIPVVGGDGELVVVEAPELLEVVELVGAAVAPVSVAAGAAALFEVTALPVAVGDCVAPDSLVFKLAPLCGTTLGSSWLDVVR
jgi:hypothetical protein